MDTPIADPIVTPIVEPEPESKKIFTEMFDSLDTLRNDIVTQFVNDTLQAQVSTIKKNLLSLGYYDIFDSSVGDIRAQKQAAIIQWFTDNGCSENKYTIKSIDSSWKITLLD